MSESDMIKMGESFLKFKDDLKEIIGDIWYIRDRFDIICKEKGVLNKTESEEDIVRIMAQYNPGNYSFFNRYFYLI